MKNHFYIRLFLLTGIFFCATALQAQYTPQEIDSMEQRLQTPNLPDEEIYEIYGNFIYAFMYDEPEQALEYARKGMNFAKKIHNDFYLAMFYYLAGEVHIKIPKLDSTMYYHDLSLAAKNKAEKKEVKDKTLLYRLEADLLILSSDVHRFCGRYDLALEDLFKALNIAEEKINTPSETGYIYASIGEIYSLMENYQKAEFYYLKYLEICRETDAVIGLAGAHAALGGIYYSLYDFQKALEYTEEASRIYSTMPYVPIPVLSNLAGILADIWLEIPDYDKALEYILMSVEYARQLNAPRHTATALIILSKYYMKVKKYKEAEEAAFQALEADSTHIYTNSHAYQMIAMSNIRMKNVEKSLEYFQKTLNARSDYSNENYQSSLSEMEVQYETEKKEMKIAALEEKNS